MSEAGGKGVWEKLSSAKRKQIFQYKDNISGTILHRKYVRVRYYDGPNIRNQQSMVCIFIEFLEISQKVLI